MCPIKLNNGMVSRMNNIFWNTLFKCLSLCFSSFHLNAIQNDSVNYLVSVINIFIKTKILNIAWRLSLSLTFPSLRYLRLRCYGILRFASHKYISKIRIGFYPILHKSEINLKLSWQWTPCTGVHYTFYSQNIQL